MPNWATTVMKFKGSQADICELHGFLTSSSKVVDFNRLIPEKENDNNWYEWRCENWGTKWNSDSYWNDDYTLTMRTAWAPPAPILNKIEELFPKLVIDMKMYEEFEGLIATAHYENSKETLNEIENGKIVKTTESEIENKPIKKINIYELKLPFISDLNEDLPEAFIFLDNLSEKMDDKLIMPIHEHFWCDQCINSRYLGVHNINGEEKQCVQIVISEKPIEVENKYEWWQGAGNKIEKGRKPCGNALEGLYYGSFVVWNNIIMLCDDPRIDKKLTKKEIERINAPYINHIKIVDKDQATPEEIALWNYYNGEGHYESEKPISAKYQTQ